ncbi:MAG: hypothetical protein KDJ76_08375 [Xanthobacteraceae bacterium]|nr:hypothetical protein [Xanthobacteraceae bacterium]
MPKLAVVFAFLMAGSAAAAAQPMQNRSGTDAEQKACARDVTRHCRKLMDQGDFVILGCLQQHRARLSKACARVLADHGQ